MDSDQGAPAPSQTAGNGNAAVLLGLYLLLLAFFILLVAISRIVETRSSAALNSVNGAFSAAVEATAPTAFAPIVTGPIVEIEEFQGRIRAAVEEALPVAEVLVVQSGRVLRVRISMNVAFVRDEARLSRAMPPLLARLAGAMGPAAEESRAEIELRVGVRDTGAPTAAGDAALAVRWAGLLARKLVDAGVAPQVIAAGVDADLAALELRFVVPAADAARVTFKDLAVAP